MTYLATALQSFFTDYVHTQRGLSPHTVSSYRDTWRLFIKHLTHTTGVSADGLELADITRDTVTSFLDHLQQRGNTASTRNIRLTGIRVLLAYVLADHPDHAEDIRQVLAIRPAKTVTPQLSYLTDTETDALLHAPDTATWVGRRDHALLALVIATGLRITELITLDVTSIHSGQGPHVQCQGKGRKHRTTPLDPATADHMSAYLAERATRPGTALFPGPKGSSLSRDAVERRLAIHVATAVKTCPSLSGKHVTMHSLRHTTAMRLLHAGVDLIVIALWLGHEQTSTTDIYLHADMDTKKKALERTRPASTEPGIYTPAPDILRWLQHL